MLRGVSLIVQTPFRDGSFLDPFSSCQYRLPTSEVDIGWREVFQAFVVSPMIVVVDERLDLYLEIAQ